MTPAAGRRRHHLAGLPQSASADGCRPRRPGGADRNPYNSSRYFEDTRFHHTSPINDAIAEEGLVSILGVPLILGGNVIGVLYAANRSERPFDRDNVSLLVSLAAHAAIALDNARLLSETSAAWSS